MKDPVNTEHFQYNGPEIIYEDNHLIAVNKRPSDIVQADKTLDTPMTIAIREYLKYTYQKPGDAFIGVVHRLDRPVSGAVIFAKTSKALIRMNQIFKSREITKKYWAIVKERPSEPSALLSGFITKNERQNKSYVHMEHVKGSVKAELKYKMLGESENYCLIEVELLTGRHHQIRAQLASIGCPIKGDVKYGFPRPNSDLSVSLHSRSIEFIHPVRKEPLKIIASPPADPLWDYFNERFSEVM